MTERPPPDARRSAILRSPAVQIGAEAAAFAMMAFAAIGLVVTAERREIAAGLAEDWLRDQGVDSDIQVDHLGPEGFVGSMRVGPRDNPVFVSERVEVAFDMTAPWAGGPFAFRPRAIRLVRPRLRVTFDGRQFSAGQLDPLISDFLARPATREPGPAVLIEDSLTTIVTRNGNVRVAGDAALNDGRLLRADGRLLPVRLKGKDFAFDSPGGTFRLTRTGERLATDLRLKVAGLTTANLDLDAADAAIEGTIPYPDPETQAVAGPARLRAAVVAASFDAGEIEARALAAGATFNGSLAGSPANATFTGRMNGQARAAAFAAGELDARTVRAVFSSGGVTLGRRATAFPFAADIDAGRMSVRGYDFTTARIDADGRFRAGADGYLLTATAAASGDSGLPAVRARRIAAATPVVSADPAQEQAIAQALQRFRARASRLEFSARNGEVRLALTGPVTLRAPGGGEAVVTPHGPFSLLGGKPGGFDIALRGGGLPQLSASVSSWSYRGGATDATLALKAAFDAPPARDAVVDLAGVLRVRRERTTFTLTRCGTASADVLDFGDIDVTDAAATVCPGGGPFVVASGGRWRVLGRFDNGRAEVPVWSAAGSDGSGAFEFAGEGALNAADIDVAAIRLTDTGEPKRFNPVRASGGANLEGGMWQGAFPVSTDADDPVGTFYLTHNVASGAGQGRIDASNMVFAKEGLQPVDVLPVAEIIRDAEGPAAFAGLLTWGPEGVSSSGTLTTPGLNFRSPAGQVTGLETTLEFVSLAPLVTAPDQQLTLERLGAIVPLEDVAATFNLAADIVHIDAATATVANGRAELEPLSGPLGADATVTGVLNLSRIDVGAIVADTTLADRIKVEAVVDGRLPFSLGPEGLRFTEGRLVAARPGRISISREVLQNVSTQTAPPELADDITPDAPPAPHPMDAVTTNEPPPAHPMDATPPEEEFNAVEHFAYQAMENLAFDTLSAAVETTDAGRLNVLFRIRGYHDPAVHQEAVISIADALAGDAFNQPLPLPSGTKVNLTLDTSLNFAELLAAWRRGWVDAAQP